MKTLSASRAASTLGVSTSTLYAYVSRGLIRSVSSDSDRRERRYLVEDIERFMSRRESRKPTAPGTAPAWFIETSLSDIDDGRLTYRGTDATTLARNASVGDVAALLWTGETKLSSKIFSHRARVPSNWNAISSGINDLAVAERFQILLTAAADEDVSAWDLRPAAAARSGAAILQVMAESIAARSFEASTGVSDGLASAWADRKNGRAQDLIRASLILSAERELDLPTYTARAIAAAGSTPYAAVSGALSAFRGVRHGGRLARVESLLAEVARPADAVPVIRGRLERGESVPGFGHRLFPDGDPRARVLISMLDDTAKSSKVWARAERLIESADELIGERPSLEFALVATTRAMGFPDNAATIILTIGRSIGWIAHTIEEYTKGQVVAPPVRYVG